MDENINITELAALVKAKRGKRGLRDVAQEIGNVSASTLSRIEQGKLPDLATFARICRWLGVSPERFMGSGDATGSALDVTEFLDTPAVITAHLRAERVLDSQTIEALSTMIRLAYEASQRGLIGNSTQKQD